MAGKLRKKLLRVNRKWGNIFAQEVSKAGVIGVGSCNMTMVMSLVVMPFAVDDKLQLAVVMSTGSQIERS